MSSLYVKTWLFPGSKWDFSQWSHWSNLRLSMICGSARSRPLAPKIHKDPLFLMDHLNLRYCTRLQIKMEPKEMLWNMIFQLVAWHVCWVPYEFSKRVGMDCEDSKVWPVNICPTRSLGHLLIPHASKPVVPKKIAWSVEKRDFHVKFSCYYPLVICYIGDIAIENTLFIDIYSLCT